MQVSTKAIVLSKLRYKDNDLIVKCYTENFGLKSYLVRNAFNSKKGKLKAAYFQLFTVLNIEADHKNNRSLHFFKEVHIYKPFKTLHTHILKSTVVLFLAEILGMALKEEEKNTPLFNFFLTAIFWFDSNEKAGSFHLVFLVKITKYLGFYPDNTNNTLPYFNLEDGSFEATKNGPYSIGGSTLNNFKVILGIKFDGVVKIMLSPNEKEAVLNMILVYFKLHLHGFKQPKSLPILNQVFS